MNSTKRLILSTILASILTVLIMVCASALSDGHKLPAPHDNLPKANISASVVLHTYLKARSNADGQDFYHLYPYDRVIVDYEENGYYFVTLQVDIPGHEKIVGWAEKQNILFDEDVKK